MISRVASLHVPALPLQALLRAEPALRGARVAVLESPSSGARVLAASPEAEAHGVSPGQMPAQARAACPEVVLRTVSRQAMRSAQEALLDVAWAFSRQVEPGDGESVQLEVGDLGPLFPSEAGLAAALRAHAARAGLEAHAAVAASSPLAQVLARTCSGVSVVPAGQERAVLAPLPIFALRPSREVLQWLSLWGVRTVGDLAALQRSQIARRLGAAGVALHRLASGEDHTPLRPAPPPAQVREAMELEDPIERLEPLSFVLRGLLDRLCARLQVLGQPCSGYTLRLALCPRGEDVRAVHLEAPACDAASLLSPARLSLAARPPIAPVRAIAVVTTPSAALARLQVLCGLEGIGALSVLDTYLPGQAQVVSFPERTLSRPALPRGPLAVQVFRPPWPAQVTLLRGAPHLLRTESLTGRIVCVWGPYRLRVGFQQPVLRDYFDIELEGGGVFCRVYQDLCTGAWFLDGRYD